MSEQEQATKSVGTKLLEIRTAAQRSLDGMSYNKDKLALQAILLCSTVEKAMALIREQEAELKKLRGGSRPMFGSTFDDVFRDIFGSR